MASSDNSVEIKIVGTVDPSLAASTAQAKAVINEVATSAQSSMAAADVATSVSAENMRKAMAAVGGDLSKVTPEMLGLNASGAAASNAMNNAAASALEMSSAVGAVEFSTLQSGIDASLGLDRSLISARQSAKAFQEAIASTAQFTQFERDSRMAKEALAGIAAGEALAAKNAEAGQAIANAYAGVKTEFKSAAESAAVFNAALDPQRSQVAMAKDLRLAYTTEAEAAAAVGNALNGTRKIFKDFTQVVNETDAATDGLRLTTSGMIQEYVRMGRAVATGRFDILPSEFATAASRAGGLGTVFGGLSTTALVAGGSVAILAAGVGYLVYEALKGAQQLDNLDEAFRLTGRGADVTRQSISDEIDFLNSLQGVTHETALAFEKVASVHADVSAELTDEVGQLLPAFVDAYGKQAPEAAGKLLEALSNLTESGFRRLDSELLNLSPQEYEQIDNLIRIGETAKATSLILAALSGHSGVYIKSIGDEVYDTEQKLSDLKRQLTEIESSPIILVQDGSASRLVAITKQITDLTNHLAELRKRETNQGHQEADTAYKRQIDDATKINAQLDQQATITKQITVFQNDLNEARKRGDAAGIASFTQAIGNEEKKLEELKQKQSSKLTGFGNGGAEAIAKARETISEINADQTKGDAERVAEIQNTYAAILASGKLNAAQITAIETAKNDAITQSAKQAAHELDQIARDQGRTEIELARIAYADKKAELDKEVAAGRMTKAQELAILISYLNVIKGLQLDAENASEKNYAKDSIAFAEAEDRKKLIAARTAQQIKQLQAELAADTAKTYGTMLGTIESAEQRMVHGIFSGTQSLKQVMFSVVDQIAEKWVIGELKTLTEHVMVEGQKTVATEAGVTARTTIEAAGHAASAAAGAASGSAQILNDAYKAAAGAYSAIVGIPYVGPILAPIAAGVAFTAVSAFDVMTSAAGGQWQVMRDGQITELHKDEMVLPAWAASPLRNMVSAPAGASGSAHGGHPPVHAHIHLHGEVIDGAGITAWWDKHSTRMARLVAREWNRNQSLRPSY